MSHKYFYLYRPPCYGCQPDGFTTREGGLPQKMYQAQHGPVRAFGWVEYPEPLTIEQVWKWEFIPDNPVEFAQYAIWEHVQRNAEYAEAMTADYIAAYRSKIGRIPEHILWAVEILAKR